jgi:hypothetical protein
MLEMNVFKPCHLTTDVAIRSAMAELEARVGDLDTETLIDDLLSQPLLLEFVLSGK